MGGSRVLCVLDCDGKEHYMIETGYQQAPQIPDLSFVTLYLPSDVTATKKTATKISAEPPNELCCVSACRRFSNRYTTGPAAKLLESCQTSAASAKTLKRKSKSIFRMLSIFSSKKRMESPVLASRLSSNIWKSVDHVIRLPEVKSSVVNDAGQADAISFTVSESIYLYGFSIFGPVDPTAEAQYEVDTILYRGGKELLMESTGIKGVGVILPVVFERAVVVDKEGEYTLEVYIKGPESSKGESGKAKIRDTSACFTFRNAPNVKQNRTSVASGQIPGLYFSLKDKYDFEHR